MRQLGDELNGLRQDAAQPQQKVDSLRTVVVRQDRLLRQVAGMAGVRVAPGVFMRARPLIYSGHEDLDRVLHALKLRTEGRQAGGRAQRTFPRSRGDAGSELGGAFRGSQRRCAVYEKSKTGRHSAPGEIVSHLKAS